MTFFKWFLVILRQTFRVIYGFKQEYYRFYQVKRLNVEDLFKNDEYYGTIIKGCGGFRKAVCTLR